MPPISRTFTWARVLTCVTLLAACAQPPSASTPEAAATVGTHAISMADVDARVQQQEPDAWQQMYEARRRALSSLIDEKLLAEQAANLGISVDSLIAREVTASVPAVTDEDVSQFFAQNEARMGGQSLDTLRDQIHEYLEGQNARQARFAYVAGLREATSVDILLQPPRVQIETSADESSRGPVDAPILIVEYSDFECPYCMRAQPALQQVLETYGDKVRLVFRDFPLRIHDNAHLAAQASRCAGDQGKFWEYHDVLFDNIRALRSDDLQRYAADLSLDEAAFSDCLQSGRHAEAVNNDLQSGQRYGVSGTPAFFINGRLLSGAQPFANFQQIIDEELARN